MEKPLLLLSVEQREEALRLSEKVEKQRMRGGGAGVERVGKDRGPSPCFQECLCQSGSLCPPLKNKGWETSGVGGPLGHMVNLSGGGPFSCFPPSMLHSEQGRACAGILVVSSATSAPAQAGARTLPRGSVSVLWAHCSISTESGPRGPWQAAPGCSAGRSAAALQMFTCAHGSLSRLQCLPGRSAALNILSQTWR